MRLLPLLLLLGAAPATAPAGPAPGVVRVRLDTAAGPITLALDARRAPRTVANFLLYVDDGRLDGTAFFRAARRKAAPGGFVQGGPGTEARRLLPPVPLEPTSRTGLRHVDGAVSLARFDRTDSGTANFSILVGATPSMDARPGNPGYAVFGRVVAGMDTVKRILAQPTGPGGSGAMKGQLLVRPVTIRRAVRLDGVARPTGRPKPWTFGI
jgi:peptidyl-prolyl cis-trans isomerase A (cyclophilin A)